VSESFNVKHPATEKAACLWRAMGPITRILAVVVILVSVCQSHGSLRPVLDPVEHKIERAAFEPFRRARLLVASVSFSVLYKRTAKVTPGSGFSGATAQPPARGDPLAVGYIQKPISHWDAVPYQTFTGKFNVGVVAFHICEDGIEFVRFYANGEDHHTDVSTLCRNPATDVVEYTALLDAADFADGPIEVRAIAYPVDGVPRVLGSLWLNANSGGTLTSGKDIYVATTGNDTTGDGSSGAPFATPMKAFSALGGGDASHYTVHMGAGTYTIGDTVYPEAVTLTGYITFQPAAGVARSDVVITGRSGGGYVGIYTDRVHWHNLTFHPVDSANLSGLFNGTSNQLCWIDRCDLIGPGRVMDVVDWVQAGIAGLAMTDCTVAHCMQPPWHPEFWLSRNVTVDDTAGGGGANIAQNATILNYTVTGTDSSGYEDVHSHVLQTYGGILQNNIILYNVRAPLIEDGLGFLTSTDGLADIAIIDCYLNNQLDPAATGATVFYVLAQTTNMLVKDSTFVGSSLWGDSFTATDVVIDNVTFELRDGTPTSPGPKTGVRYR
jgi:hypothetical protein